MAENTPKGFRYKAIIQNANKDECNVTVECDDESLLKYLHREIKHAILQYNGRLLRAPRRLNEQCMECKSLIVKETVKTSTGLNHNIYGCELDNDPWTPYCKDFTKKHKPIKKD